jgi:hypothetical protein
MSYRFAVEQQDYSDFASGRVFCGAPGYPAFPVRLASEIFQRCLAHREANHQPTAAWRLYDPCCGGAYHLCTLAYLHWPAIAELIGSDVDAQALSLAERNFSLLTLEGLQRRRAEIARLFTAYGKASHRAALETADTLQRKVRQLLTMHPVKTRVFCADATDPIAVCRHLGGVKVDLVITDLPYGRQVHWQAGASAPCPSPVWLMLNALCDVLSSASLVAIAADKQQKIAHEHYRRMEHFRLGKRQVAILKLG